MPFNFSENFDVAYQIIDQLHHGHEEYGSLVDIANQATQIRELYDCFELEGLTFHDVDSLINDAKKMKHVWDLVSLALATQNSCKSIRWCDIYVKNVVDSVKNLECLVDDLGINASSWPVLQVLKVMVKNLQLSLTLVGKLQNNCLRSRHWKQLMRITGTSFTIDDKLLLGDMLSLQLHNHEKSILELVDKACKEFEIEKKLNEIE